MAFQAFHRIMPSAEVKDLLMIEGYHPVTSIVARYAGRAIESHMLVHVDGFGSHVAGQTIDRLGRKTTLGMAIIAS
jgi:hypothetical protein